MRGTGATCSACRKIWWSSNYGGNMKKKTVLLLMALPVLIHAQAGIITTVAGTGTPGFSGDGGPAASAQISGLGQTLNVAVDNAGNLLIVDGGNHRIRKVNAAGTINTDRKSTRLNSSHLVISYAVF